jgi:protein-S-isoprenylcysteine O-methyltransferase Ste14
LLRAAPGLTGSAARQKLAQSICAGQNKMTPQQSQKLLPPHYFLLTLLAQAGLHWLVPGPLVVPTPGSYAGAILVILGIWIASSSSQLFARRGTAIRPFEKSSVLVTDGWFRCSRNPMYVAMLMINLGIAVLLGSAIAFLPVALLAWVLRNRFIIAEEKMLAEQFGSDFDAYRQKVRRWI